MALIFGGQQTFAAEGDLQDAVDEVLGVPYKWGGTSSAGFDCSGFIIYIFKQYEIKLPRTSQTQAKEGVEVAKEDLKQGDLVFFNTSGKGISHAGIYLGGGKFAHSSSSKGVIVSKMSDSYYESRYVTARRVISST
ncbi:C40 family peptidase [Paenibacillus sp. B01]|uniref:C40 family peptidase n=1 Tax=Paenibacillus sp. B01 TaxID=2660554 RepID=UPI00129A10C8|nr:C40 family peptidase [Paenibacillus sp. B01]QGG58610.1 NlpC/P60 family protein [Paenibacillus sp. B01]